MVKKSVLFFLALHFLVVLTMEQEDSVGSQNDDQRLRQIKGNPNDEFIEKLNNEKYKNVYQAFLKEKSDKQYKSSSAQRTLLLQLTYYFKDDNNISYLNNTGTSNTTDQGYINSLFTKNERAQKIKFFNDFCAGTSYYFFIKNDNYFDVFYNSFARYIMNIEHIETRTQYVQKYVYNKTDDEKNILSIGHDYGPSREALAGQFLEPEFFLDDVLLPVCKNGYQKKQFFKEYLNKFLEVYGKEKILGYCYFFNTLFEKLFKAGQDKLESCLNSKNNQFLSNIEDNKFVDKNDFLSLFLYADNYENSLQFIKDMEANSDYTVFISPALRSEKIFPADNNPIISKLFELVSQVNLQVDQKKANSSGTLSKSDGDGGAKVRKIIESLSSIFGNDQNVFEAIKENLIRSQENIFYTEIEKYLMGSQKHRSDLEDLFYKGKQTQQFNYESCVSDFIQKVSKQQQFLVAKKLVEILIKNKTLDDNVIAKLINDAFLNKITYSKNQKNELIKMVRYERPNIESVFSHQTLGNKNDVYILYPVKSRVFDYMSSTDKDILLRSFAVPGMNYISLLKHVTDLDHVKKVSEILNKFSDNDKTEILQEMADCFCQYQDKREGIRLTKDNIYIFGYSAFFNNLTSNDKVLDQLTHGEVQSDKKESYTRITVDLNYLSDNVSGYLSDPLDFYSDEFRLDSFFVAVRDANDNPYKKGFKELFASPQDSEIQERILTQLINKVKNVKPQGSIVIQSVVNENDVKSVCNVLNAILTIFDAGTNNKNAFAKIAQKIINDQKLSINYEKELFATYQLPPHGKDLMNVLGKISKTISNTNKVNDDDKKTIANMWHDRVEGLSDKDFLAIFYFLEQQEQYFVYKKDPLNKQYFKKEKDTLSKQFFDLSKNNKKKIQKNKYNTAYEIVDDPVKLLRAFLTADSQVSLDKIMGPFEEPDSCKKYVAICNMVQSFAAFYERLTGLKRNSKGDIIAQSISEGDHNILIKDFCNKFDVYHKNRFVFGHVKFFNDLNTEKGIKSTNYQDQLDFISFESNDVNRNNFLSAITIWDQEKKEAFIAGLKAYIDCYSKKDEDHLIYKMCAFLNWDINNINSFLLQLEPPKDAEVASLVFKYFKAHYFEKDIKLLKNPLFEIQITPVKTPVSESTQQQPVPVANPLPTNPLPLATNLLVSEKQDGNPVGLSQSSLPGEGGGFGNGGNNKAQELSSEKGSEVLTVQNEVGDNSNVERSGGPDSKEGSESEDTGQSGSILASIGNFFVAIGSVLAWPFKALFNLLF